MLYLPQIVNTIELEPFGDCDGMEIVFALNLLLFT